MVDSARQLLALGSGMGGFRTTAAAPGIGDGWIPQGSCWHSRDTTMAFCILAQSSPVGDKGHDLPVSLACASCPTAMGIATTKDSRGEDTHASQRGDHERLSRGRHPCFTAGRPRKTLEGKTLLLHSVANVTSNRSRCAARFAWSRSSTRMALRCTGSDLKLCLPPSTTRSCEPGTSDAIHGEPRIIES